MQKLDVRIIAENNEGKRVVASAARISTTDGTALEIFRRSGNAEKDDRLICKVLASGHKSVLEHQALSLALENVSVFAEQFIIESRLSSFTVKSRRYVDFSEAGFVVPDGLPQDLSEAYGARMQALFDVYHRLLDAGIPREDARFVLPYCFRSNLYATMNARELTQLIFQLTQGRGRLYPELKAIGESLGAQFEALYPGVLTAEASHLPETRTAPLPDAFTPGRAREGEAELVDFPTDAVAALERALRFSGRFSEKDGHMLTPDNMLALLRDGRPRELECVSFTFRLKNVSQAAITHFTRHRMLSLMTKNPAEALAGGNFVLPASIAESKTATALYLEAFHGQTASAQYLQARGLPETCFPYLALAGHVSDLFITLNARELNHFMKLRTCSRAQWEIRGIAEKMLALLQQKWPEIFWAYGPSCQILGRCPEGRLSCGNLKKLPQIEGVDTL